MSAMSCGKIIRSSAIIFERLSAVLAFLWPYCPHDAMPGSDDRSVDNVVDNDVSIVHSSVIAGIA